MPEGEGSSADAGQGTSADAGTQGAGQQQQQQAPPPADAGQQQQSDDSAAVIARLNSEAKQNRLRAEAAEAKIKEFEEGQMTELQKSQARLADMETRSLTLERENQELRVGGLARDAATKAGAVDATAVQRMLDLALVEFDDAGKPKNLDKLVGDIKQAHPALFNAVRGNGDTGPRGGGSNPTDMNELIRRAAGRSA